MTNFLKGGSHRSTMLVVGIIILTTLSVGSLYRHSTVQSRQAEVATRGTQVMPFDLEATTHIFKPLPDGGLQTVLADNPTDTEQIALIQTHLQEEAQKFSTGDFSDPATIHGHAMPGLQQLTSNYPNIQVKYTALPEGAEIRYTTQQETLTTAIHDWFAAQRSDHGHHAR